MLQFLWICLGGALGTGCRYLVGLGAARALGTGFPYGTLAVNVLGSFLLTFLMTLAMSTEWISPTLRLVLATGFLGGFTTYSSFNYETLKLFQTGGITMAALNLLLTVGTCLGVGLLGMFLASKLV